MKKFIVFTFILVVISSFTLVKEDLGDPIDCVKEKCPTQYDACTKDPKCLPALQYCEKKCGTNKNCWTFCLPGQGSQTAIDTAKCAAANGCVSQPAPEIIVADPTDCIKQKCPDEYAICTKDPKCLPTLQDCSKKCGTSQTCWGFCLNKAGDKAAVDTAKCAAKNGCVSQQVSETAVVLADPIDCVKEKCPTQYDACTKDPKCLPALQYCEKKCGTNKNCWTFCLPGQGSQTAIDTAKCAAANGCVSQPAPEIIVADPIDCVKEKCPTQYDACTKDPKCLPALQYCEKKCGTNKNCWTFCLPGQGSQTAIDTAKCAAANGCVSSVGKCYRYEFENCMSESCSESVQDCLSDKLCTFYLRKCRVQGKVWQFDLQCLHEKSAFHPRIARWYKCGGEHKCL